MDEIIKKIIEDRGHEAINLYTFVDGKPWTDPFGEEKHDLIATYQGPIEVDEYGKHTKYYEILKKDIKPYLREEKLEKILNFSKKI